MSKLTKMSSKISKKSAKIDDKMSSGIAKESVKIHDDTLSEIDKESTTVKDGNSSEKSEEMVIEPKSFNSSNENTLVSTNQVW